MPASPGSLASAATQPQLLRSLHWTIFLPQSSLPILASAFRLVASSMPVISAFQLTLRGALHDLVSRQRDDQGHAPSEGQQQQAVPHRNLQNKGIYRPPGGLV